MKELLTELRNKVLYLRNTKELSAKGELILLHKLNALEKQFAISGVSKSFALGKEAIIVECFKGHEFEDGEVVEIVEKFDNELWIVKSKATGKEWYITEEEANVC